MDFDEFRKFLDKMFYDGFDPTDLTDDEYQELEDLFQDEQMEGVQ